MGPKRLKHLLLVGAALAFAACDDSTPTAVGPADATGSDAGADTADAVGTPDIAPVDVVAPDASLPDASPPDADPDPGSAPDAVMDMGVGTPDADAIQDTGPDAIPDAVTGACPPTGPFGHGVGDTLTNYTLMTCDNEPVDVHELCGANAGLIFNFYGW